MIGIGVNIQYALLYFFMFELQVRQFSVMLKNISTIFRYEEFILTQHYVNEHRISLESKSKSLFMHLLIKLTLTPIR